MVENRGFWERNKDVLIDQIHFTLVFWKKKYARILKNEKQNYNLKNKPKYSSKIIINSLVELKIIECVSFWKGFIEVYGYYPPKISTHELPSRITTNPSNKGDSIGVVIPIGSNAGDVIDILCNSLRILIDNKIIKKILCIADGIYLPTEIENWMRKENKIQLIRNKSSVGPATIRNLGIRLLIKEKYSDILLLDSDIHLTTKSFHNLIQNYIKCSSCIVFPKIISKDNSIFNFYYDINGILNGRYLNSNQPQKSLLYGTTSVVLVNQEIFTHGYLFDEKFSIAGGEDIDFCLRLINSGKHLSCLDNVVIEHYYGNLLTKEDAINILKNRFDRYGRGDAMLTKKHPYFYSWLNKSSERI